MDSNILVAKAKFAHKLGSAEFSSGRKLAFRNLHMFMSQEKNAKLHMHTFFCIHA